jgi:hypothetical protein
VVTCEICGKEFKSKLALAAHKKIHRTPAEREPVSHNPTNAINVDNNIVLQALQMLDEGHSPIEIMMIHKLDVPTMMNILHSYRDLTALTRPEKSAAEGMLQIAKLFGERIRDGCDSYNEEQGICTEFSLYDIDEEFRRAYPGLFKGSGGKTRFHVGNHPQRSEL